MSGPRPGSPTPPATPPQAPLTGRARRLLGRLHFTGVFWFRLHAWGMRILPSWLVGTAIALFTAFFFLTLRRIRSALATNLEAVLGPCGPLERHRRIWRVMWNQAWCNSERYERLSTERPFEIEVEGREHWPGAAEGAGAGAHSSRQLSSRAGADARECKARDGRATQAYSTVRRGAQPSGTQQARADAPAQQEAGESCGLVLVTAHVGAWDVGSFLPGSVESRHVHVVREQEVDREAQRFIEELYRERASAAFTTHFSRDNPTLGAKLLAALRRGEIVGIQGDRPSSTGRSVEVELFGRPLALPVGPAALARAAGVPLVPVFCFREGRRRYRLVIRPPMEVPSGGDRDAELAAAVRAVGAEVERAIRRRPYQWFCFRNLWGE